MTTAHRAAWVGANGRQVPDGLTVDHICHVRLCVNPMHLRLRTNIDNARDNGQIKGQAGHDQLPAVALLGEMCRRGHQLVGYPSGARACRECTADHLRRKRAKWRRQRAA